MSLDSLAALRQAYAAPKGRSVAKQLAALDVHCTRFIALSPFVVLATGNRTGQLDASPRGGDPGFVKVLDAQTLLLPDSPGNNRLDSFTNLLETREAGLLFLIPGVDETLRVNGPATLCDSAWEIALCTTERRAPKAVIRITVREAYLHCAKAFMRSDLWNPAKHVARSALPSMGEMIRDQTGMDAPIESQEAMRARYASDL
jgi:PPOX class probable FMN-dependent enzyme